MSVPEALSVPEMGFCEVRNTAAVSIIAVARTAVSAGNNQVPVTKTEAVGTTCLKADLVGLGTMPRGQ